VLVPLRDFRKDFEREDVFGIEIEHLAKYRLGAGVIFLVNEAATVDDVTADIVRMQLQSGLAQLNGVIYKPRFAIRVRQRREVPPFGILPVARFELFDLASVRHALSLCGDWCKIVLGRPGCQITPRALLA
jgi:hypothetical protein